MNSAQVIKTQLDKYTKEYVYILDEYTDCDGQYRHPVIRFYHLGTSYPEGRYCSFGAFKLEYQITVKDNTNKSYGGRIEYLRIEDFNELTKILKAAQSQIDKLQIHSGDSYKDMLTALRAAGYREGVKQDSYIVAIN
jgi:hypothetical protein